MVSNSVSLNSASSNSMIFECTALFQAAVYDRLSANIALDNLVTSIYDAPPDTAMLPYISFGQTRSSHNDTKSFRGVVLSFEIIVWSSRPGQMQAKNIMAAVDTCLHQTPLLVEGFDIIGFRLDQSLVEKKPATAKNPAMTQGKMTYRVSLFEALD